MAFSLQADAGVFDLAVLDVETLSCGDAISPSAMASLAAHTGRGEMLHVRYMVAYVFICLLVRLSSLQNTCERLSFRSVYLLAPTGNLIHTTSCWSTCRRGTGSRRRFA